MRILRANCEMLSLKLCFRDNCFRDKWTKRHVRLSVCLCTFVCCVLNGVCHLLANNAERYLHAKRQVAYVLRVAYSIPHCRSRDNTVFAAPATFFRTNSVRELGLFAENANAMNRLIQQHISFTEACSLTPFDAADGLEPDICFPSISDGDSAFLERAVFQLGVSDDETEDQTLGVWSDDELCQWSRADACKQIKLPGASKLARRRQAMRHRCSIDSDDSGSLTSCSPTAPDFSPIS